jgi:hypothetical protein
VASESFTRGLGAHAIACKDLDGDSRIDLAVAYLGSPFVSVFHGRANGTFEPWVDVPFGSAGEGANDVEVADVDGDGRNDLVVALRSSYVAVALREPSASFAPAARFALSSVPSAVAVGRLDLDGALDVAASLYDTQSVEVLRGAGDGSFASVKVLAIREFVHDLAIADVNLNQRADIVVGAFDGSSAWVITGDGAFGFDPPRGFGAGFGPGFLTLGDFDSNGRVDLATANVGADSLGVLLHR